MKLFFDIYQSFFCFDFGQKNAKKRLIQEWKKAVKASVQVTEIDPVFWKLVQHWKETRRQMRKRYLSKKYFTYEIYAGALKAAHKVFQQRGMSSIWEFH